ncbi:YebC/PmpR family DNA-binding transcriptional regulator [Candidatus Saccharibacteria bacterium]|nr:YebC/PmpR family DNA-binding transcriptional regulator [Candidatus Saccharibacteria bacterium]MCB9834592.1 YebC/PmpR family DNA-binding transcriptional regulator [Candidatus Nomurabacteria bacterium]
MSGHSKWHSIKHQKAAADAKRGKVFTKHAGEIALAARDGDDPDMNAKLRLAIVKAKQANMPNANIDRAIARGSGKLGTGTLEELTYEGYGPGATAILVKVVTDNRNRSASDVRSTFSKYGGNLGSTGSVAYMFDRKGVIEFVGGDIDEQTLIAIDAGVEDVIEGSSPLIAITDPDSLDQIVEVLGDQVESSEVRMVANQTVSLAEKEDASLSKLVDALEEVGDVVEVITNQD